MQDILAQKFEAKIPINKFAGSCDYTYPFEASQILKIGNIVRLRGAKISEAKNVYNDTKDKLLPTQSNLDSDLKEVFHLDFESKWGLSCSIMVIPKNFLISKLLKYRVIEDSVVLKLIENNETQT